MGCEVVLEKWGCASEIKQNLNKIKAAPCKVAEEINFVKGTSYKLAPAEGNEAMPQKLNKIKATLCKPAEVLSVYSTLAKVRAAQAVVLRLPINFDKVWDEKAMCWEC